jgi:DNA-binding IclR family transcriptional regulator
VTKVAAWKRLPAIDQILELLATDKEWHDISEIALRAQLSESETMHIVDFLAKGGFLLLKKHGQKAKIEERTVKFLEQISESSVPQRDGFSIHCKT